MQLPYKPDFESVKTLWNAFWKGEIVKRPLVHAVVPRPGKTAGALGDRYYHAVHRNDAHVMRQIDQTLHCQFSTQVELQL